MYMHMSMCLWLFVQNELYAMYADGCASPASLPTVCRKKNALFVNTNLILFFHLFL